MTENLLRVQRLGKLKARKGYLFFVISLVMVLFGLSVSAQLGVYQFTGAGVCPNQNPNVSAQPANATFNAYSNLNSTCQATTDLFVTKSINTSTAIDLTEYNEFSITANNQYLLTLTSISFTQYVSANNSTTWALRSSLDNYAANLATGTATTTSQTPLVTLPAGFTSIDFVTFRLYIIGANNAAAQWTNDDVTLNGSVLAILPPTPNTPTSNSPQCNPPGVTLSASGTPPTNVEWYWQTTTSGTSTTNAASTFNVTAIGTYYLRARNTINLAWSISSASLAVTVTPNVTTPVFSAGTSSTRCQGLGTVTYTATSSNTTGITYTLDASSLSAGNTINSSNGAVTYTAGWSGTTTITANAGGCSPKSASHTVTITPSVGTPVFSAGATSTRCQGAGTVTYTATATNNSGITYSLDGTSSGAGNTINSATGAVTYVAGYSGTSVITVSASGCAGTKTSTHTVTITATVGTPVFSAGATSIRCQGAGTVSYPASASSTTGITYTLDATSTSAGNTINSTNGSVTFVAGWAGTSTITASAAGCNGPKTSAHTVTTTATVGIPVFTLGATSTRCQGAGTVTYLATATTSTGITFSLDASTIAAGNTINSSTGAVSYVAGWSGTTSIVASAAGCNGPRTATHTVTVTATVGTPVFALGATSKRCVGAGSVTYTATASTSTVITYSLDASSLSAGNTINSANGTVTFIAGYTGTSIVTANASGCNGPSTASHTITTAGLLGSPVFSAGTSSSRCQAVATITYSATATNNDGLTYSLDGSSLAGGNTINSLTGAVTYANGWFGTSTITVTAAGCGGPLTATHTVSTTQGAGTPVFAMGVSSTRCQNGASLNYSATATNSTAITYTLDAASIAGGNSINSSTLNYAAGWSGTTIITATATGCGSPSSTHTVTITPVVATPVFSSGSTSSRCQGSNNVTYSATAANSTMLSYSLDPGSLGAGNSINTSTGVVTYVSGFTGTSVITATAQGCFGPTTATHTVSTTPTVGVPVFALGATSTRCQLAETRTYSATAANANNITYTLNAASTSAGNTINSTTG